MTKLDSSVADVFEALYRVEFTPMMRLATLLGASDPENIAQDAFVRLFERWHRLSDPTRAGGYLRTTVVNLCRSEARRNAVSRKRQRAIASANNKFDAAAPSDRIPDDELMAAVRRLATRQREALVLRLWMDLSEKETAHIMKCAVGTVKSHVSQGLPFSAAH